MRDMNGQEAITDLRATLEPDAIPRARLAVAARATDADDLRRLLWMLGLLRDPEAKAGRPR